MLFHWDRGNTEHIARHEVTPQEAEQVLQNDPVDAATVLRNGEQRIVHLGETDAARFLVVVVTERDSLCRVVTARPANRKEHAFYSLHKAATNEQNPQDP